LAGLGWSFRMPGLLMRGWLTDCTIDYILLCLTEFSEIVWIVLGKKRPIAGRFLIQIAHSRSCSDGLVFAYRL